MLARSLLVSLVLGAPSLLGCDESTAQARSDEPLEIASGPAAITFDRAPPRATPAAPERSTRFLGEPEGELLRALETGAIRSIEKGRGGRSLAFKVTLDGGVQGYFKPEQRFSGAHYYAELAAYELDRELGLGRVPPTVGRSFPHEPFWQAAAGDDRRGELIVQEDGRLRGALIWWIPERLERLQPGQGWERWVRLRGAIELTPFQRPAGWSWRAEVDNGPWRDEPDRPERPEELSDMILFDFLTANVDRWGGNFTNVRTRAGGPLIYLDNGAGFSEGPEASIPLMKTRLRMVQRFNKSTVDTLRHIDLGRLRTRMAASPLGDVLSATQWNQLAERLSDSLDHVDATARELGPAVWF